MPSHFIVRRFHENGYYHIFNRGVEKRIIFLDKQDYQMFIYYLFIYLSPLEKVLISFPALPIRLYNKNLYSQVKLTSYCLMPNHFHLLLFQNTTDGISKLIKQVTNGYTLYFNERYKRVGGLVQGRFKAVEVENDEQLIHLSRYIHLNPLIAGLTDDLLQYPWSNYYNFVNLMKGGRSFFDAQPIIDLLGSSKHYKGFVEDQVAYARELDKIKHIILDD